MGSKTNPLSMVYIGTGPDLPTDGENGDIFIQISTAGPSINTKSDTEWTPVSATWSAPSITLDADDYSPTVFGKTMDEIFDIIKNEEELQRENKHLKEVLKIYETMELNDEADETF